MDLQRFSIQTFLSGCLIAASLGQSVGISPETPDGAQPKDVGTRPWRPSLETEYPEQEDRKLDATPWAVTDRFGFEGRVTFDDRGGVVRAVGDSYKIQADGTGFTYIPFFGSEAPANYPISLNLHSVTLGGDLLDIVARPLVSRTAQRITLSHGAVDVWYDLAPESVEQSFVVQAAGSAGDLQVVLDVHTELMWLPSEEGTAYGNDLGKVTYEHAVVIDGAGKRLTLPIHATGERIQIDVPGAFLASAVNPIVIDPVITTFVAYWNQNRKCQAPDVAFDLATNSFFYVQEVVTSVIDHDIWVEKIDGNTGSSLGGMWVDASTANWRLPSVASDRTSQQCLIAMIVATSSGLQEVRGVTIDAATLHQSPSFLIGDVFAGFWTNTRVDVGGKSGGPSLFKVVWQRSFLTNATEGIRSVVVHPIVPHSTTVAPTISLLEALTNSGTENFTLPAISKSSGEPANGEWRAVFLREEIATGIQKIFTCRWADDNTLLSPATPVFTPSTNFAIQRLDVSEGLPGKPGPFFGDPLYCVSAYIINPSMEDDVWVYAIERDTLFAPTLLSSREHEPWNPEQLLPALGTTRDHFVVPYLEYDLALSSYVCNYSSINVVSDQKIGVSERRVRLDTEGITVPSFPPAIASRFSGGDYASPNLAVGVQSPWGLGNTRIRGILVEANTPSICGYQYCNGNPNSTGDYGFLTVYGDAGLTQPKTLSAEALPTGQFGYFLASQGGFGTLPVAGSAGRLCLAGAAIGRYNLASETFSTGTTGSATIQVFPGSLRTPSGNVAALAGQSWNFQAWHRENGGSSNFTNAVSVLF